jgi:hypothetical protein
MRTQALLTRKFGSVLPILSDNLVAHGEFHMKHAVTYHDKRLLDILFMNKRYMAW